MMKTKTLAIVYLLTISCISVGGDGYVTRRRAPIFGAYPAKDGCQILFSTSVWPDGFQGFHIKKKPIGNSKDWENVTKKPLFPTALPSVDWGALATGEEDAERLRQKAVKLTEDGCKEQRAFASKEALEKLINSKDRDVLLWGPFAWAWDQEDFEVLLMYNAGWTDRDYKAESAVVYGLFPVIDGKTSKTPVRICEVHPKLPKDGIELTKQTVEIEADGGVVLQWEISDATCERFGFTYCAIYQEDVEEVKKPQRLDVIAGVKIGDRRIFGWTGQEKDGSPNGVNYKIVPVNFLHAELKKSFVLRPSKQAEKKK